MGWVEDFKEDYAEAYRRGYVDDEGRVTKEGEEAGHPDDWK